DDAHPAFGQDRPYRIRAGPDDPWIGAVQEDAEPEDAARVPRERAVAEVDPEQVRVRTKRRLRQVERPRAPAAVLPPAVPRIAGARDLAREPVPDRAPGNARRARDLAAVEAQLRQVEHRLDLAGRAGHER